MADAAHLDVTGLTKRFGGLVSVKDMALSVEAGKIVGLIGPNGSGKSTVMKLIMGIERPDAGSVRISSIRRLAGGSRPVWRRPFLGNDPRYAWPLSGDDGPAWRRPGAGRER